MAPTRARRYTIGVEQVRRYDTSTLPAAKRTPQGYLRVPARLTRTGVLEYKRADGTTRRELRLPEEVFNADSMESLALAPVTDLHPPEMVTPENHKQYSVGVTGEKARQDGRFLSADLTITNADAIEKVERKDRAEISCGYLCRLELTPGTYKGERYDAIQRGITYNHVAILPAGHGRAGSDVSIRLDSGDGIARFDSDADVPHADTNAKPKVKTTMDMVEIRIDGVSVEVPKQAKELFAREIERKDSALKERDDALAEIWSDSEKKSGRLDALQAERDDLKARLDEAASPEEIQKRIDARVDLLEQARKVLGAEEKLDGLNDREIREKTIAKAKGEEVNFDGKSDDYVCGLFEATVSAAKPRNDALGAARAAGASAAQEGRADAKTAREQMIERNRNMWKKAEK